METYDQIITILPHCYGKQLRHDALENLEEIRIGTGRPCRLCYTNHERQIWPEGSISLLEEIVQRACNHSVYAQVRF